MQTIDFHTIPEQKKKPPSVEEACPVIGTHIRTHEFFNL